LLEIIANLCGCMCDAGKKVKNWYTGETCKSHLSTLTAAVLSWIRQFLVPRCFCCSLGLGLGWGWGKGRPLSAHVKNCWEKEKGKKCQKCRQPVNKTLLCSSQHVSPFEKHCSSVYLLHYTHAAAAPYNTYPRGKSKSIRKITTPMLYRPHTHTAVHQRATKQLEFLHFYTVNKYIYLPMVERNSMG
jgi:hypothetical protein